MKKCSSGDKLTTFSIPEFDWDDLIYFPALNTELSRQPSELFQKFFHSFFCDIFTVSVSDLSNILSNLVCLINIIKHRRVENRLLTETIQIQSKIMRRGIIQLVFTTRDASRGLEVGSF